MISMLPSETGAQNNILLLKKKGSPKNYKYHLRNEISIRSKTGDRKISGQIHQITDSTILVDYIHEVYIEDIGQVYRDRYFFKTFSYLLFIAGAGYFILDGFNRTINHEYPIITQNTLVVTGSLVGVGLAFRFLDTKKYRIGKKWELLLLDMSY